MPTRKNSDHNKRMGASSGHSSSSKTHSDTSRGTSSSSRGRSSKGSTGRSGR